MINKFFIIIGFISLALGIIGVFVPLLPTTPFLLLSATLFAKSSPKNYQKLIQKKWLGKYILNYRSGKGIPITAKIFSLLLLWSTIGITIFHYSNYLLATILLILISIGVTIHILWIKTMKK